MTRLAVLAVLVMACSQHASSAPATTSEARTRAQASPSPVAGAGTALAACRLPVVSWYQPGNSGNVYLPPDGVQAHYVSYPDGVVSAAPADQFSNGNDGFGWRSSATPVLRATGPVGYYDAAAKRFLPVPRADVSPDGHRYVYMDYTQGGL